MKKVSLNIIFISILLFACNTNAYSIDKYIFSGSIQDINNKEYLIAATLVDTNNNNNFIITDLNGMFSIELDSGEYIFEVSYLGYQNQFYKIILDRNINLDILLSTQNTLGEVLIQSNRIKKTAEMNKSGINSLSVELLKNMPEFLGEKDILKALQLMPGVQSGNEGQRGIFVRGGSPDQNLMQYDNATIYNVAHMYNILSTFSSDAITNVDLHKSYLPAKFSNRLSSITDIQPSFGDLNKIKFNFGISPLFSNFNLQIPIKKEKASININLRDCHVGLFSGPLSAKQFEKSSELQGGSIVYYFYDINTAIQYKINEKHTLRWSFFHSQDFYKQTSLIDRIENVSDQKYYSEVNYLRWYNITNSIGIESKINDKLTVLNQFHFSNYKVKYTYNLHDKFYTYNYNYNYFYDNNSISKIQEISLLSDWKQNFNEKYNLNFGFRTNFKYFDVNNISEKDYDSTKTLISQSNGVISKYKQIESFLYADFHHKINSKLEYTFGLQATLVSVQSKSFLYALPKFQFIYTPIPILSIRNSITYNMQPLHLLASLQNGIQSDIWVPAIAKIQPQTAWQYSGGLQFNFKKQYTISVDAYYRKMYHQIEYAGSNNFISNTESWENQVALDGTGKSYGLEFFANKYLGQFTAWAKYNLSWSKRHFDELNDGKEYFFKYDKRHDFSINLQYKLKKHFDFSISWVYTSGMRATIPIAKYTTNQTINLYKNNNSTMYGNQEQDYQYSERNSYVLPAYHHLDIGMNYTKERKNLKHVFNVSIYNIYNRLNIFSIFRVNSYSQDLGYYTKYKQLTLFPILPSISYRIYFEK
ncbi:MAG: carboxypeptidase-like regulatory domain-containing protein [Sphingobacteriales bacterium]|nr:MAG: carboxypeptidase-like regulatory domain-containing protein [Sphingobacteriales bacterium]